MGLRYWNEVDEDGESSWVFECRDVSYHGFPTWQMTDTVQPSQVPNPIDTKMFWVSLAGPPTRH